MRKYRSSLIVAVLLLWTAMPALRCLIPDENLSAAERACCQRMAGECGQIPANHGCCRKTVSAPQLALSSSKVTLSVADAVLGTADTASSEQYRRPLLFAITELLDPSPPPSASTVLRI